MGHGMYSYQAHVAMTQKRASASQAELFTQRQCHDLMNPFGVKLRESRDSESHPHSLAVIFALDVSGSMGEIPAKLATDTLPVFMKALLDAKVTDPQVMFMGVGCARGDRAPLQVGQFESTESLMDQWLTWLYLEGGGGGGNESYELAMYFAARHTETDCVKKRGRRGYLFITGDEPPNPAVSRTQVKQLIGDELDADIPIAQIIEETQRSYEPFYLIPDPGRARAVERAWRDLLGDRVIVMEQPDHTSYVAAGLVSLLEGSSASLGELMQRFAEAGLAPEVGAAVARALTPFAASIVRDGAAEPPLGSAALPGGTGPSGYQR
ncbi:MAG: VWA domain-containing protein [Myxococcales bacterium]|nr:VWA domain-containing protein [Myxococcales bacterium]MCB9576230.1 VWA domain-containing protein [Polyangiaceae bacterium]